MDDRIEPWEEHGVSRRRLIKGAMVAGGSLWAAPIVDSVFTAAAAGSRTPTCPPFKCDGTASPLCGNAGPGGSCLCAPTTEGTNACVTALGFVGPFNCQSSAACPEGAFCILVDPTTCSFVGAPFTVCAGPCV